MVSKFKNLIQFIGFLSIYTPFLIAPSAWGVCAGDLQKQVEIVVQSPSLRSLRVGVFASKLDSFSNPLVNIDGDKYFTPASNLKLFTTAAALELLGANYQIRTSLWVDQSGELWLRGSGDPSFSEDTLRSLVNSLVRSLKVRGIKAIAPDLKTIPDLKGSGLGMGWQWQDLQEYYGAIADAFIINENVLDWTITPTKINKPVQFSWDRPDLAVGWVVENRAITASENTAYSLMVERSQSQKKLLISGQFPQNTPPELGATAIPDPEAHFLRMLRAEMLRQGIILKSPNKSPVKSQGQNQSSLPITEVAIEAATILSPTLAELIKTTNKESNNLYAESLLRRLGLSSTLPSDPTENPSESDRGIDLVNKFLVGKGISSDSVVIKDGSGLSTLNLVTPRAIAQLLIGMKDNMIFRASLPIAGIDGTLKNRFKSVAKSPGAENNLPVANIQAKTGTLTGVNALSGYLKPPKYPELAFSIVINNSNLSTVELAKDIDAIALLLMTVEDCNRR